MVDSPSIDATLPVFGLRTTFLDPLVSEMTAPVTGLRTTVVNPLDHFRAVEEEGAGVVIADLSENPLVVSRTIAVIAMADDRPIFTGHLPSPTIYRFVYSSSTWDVHNIRLAIGGYDNVVLTMFTSFDFPIPQSVDCVPSKPKAWCDGALTRAKAVKLTDAAYSLHRR